MAEDATNREQSNSKKQKMTFWDHLDELRNRLIKASLAITIGLCIAYAFVPYVQLILIDTFFPSDQSAPLAFLRPTEGFIVRLKLAFAIGLLLASPIVFFQFWRFVVPGLYPKEIRLVIPVAISSTISFLCGAAFSVLVLPHATNFFLEFTIGGVENTWSFASYVDFVIRLMLAFGLVFELPLVIFFLVRLGIVTPQFLRKQRRYAIVIFLVMAAVISPPDIFTMVVLAVPLTVLYELSILLAVFARKKSDKKDPEASHEDIHDS